MPHTLDLSFYFSYLARPCPGYSYFSLQVLAPKELNVSGGNPARMRDDWFP